MKRAIANSRPVRSLRRMISVNPALYIPIRRQTMAHTLAAKDTELLIEGFPRSGNTWSEAVIRHCGREDIRLAHHSHAAAHVKHAKRIGVPAMVLYREPDAAVRSSLTLQEGTLRPRDAYLDYITFYRETASLMGEGVMFFSFEDATKRASDMVRALNANFGLGLRECDLEDEAEKEAVFERMDAKAARLNNVKSRARPGSSEGRKEDQQASAKAAIEDPSLAALRDEARKIYEGLSSSLAGA